MSDKGQPHRAGTVPGIPRVPALDNVLVPEMGIIAAKAAVTVAVKLSEERDMVRPKLKTISVL